MKILFPIGSFYPAQSGGPSNTIYWLSKTLKKEGIQPIVITTDKDIKDFDIIFNQYINDNKIGEIIYCKESNYKFSFNLIKHTLKKIKNVDIVHLTSLFFIPSIIIAFFAKFYDKKVIWSVRGELESSALKYKTNYKKLYLNLIKILINKNFIFHSTSKAETQNIKKIFPNIKIIEIPNYIELPERYNMEIKNNILFLGRIHPIKNIESLIEAFAKIIKETNIKDYKLIIAGIGEQEYIESIFTLINNLNIMNYVDMIGMITGEEKQKLIASSYVLVLPSFSENFGNVVVEALSQGTPVIASKGTPWNILEEFKAGYWIDNSIEDIFIALEKIIKLNDKEYNFIRKNSLWLAKNKYDIHKNINKWIEKYQEIING